MREVTYTYTYKCVFELNNVSDISIIRMGLNRKLRPYLLNLYGVPTAHIQHTLNNILKKYYRVCMQYNISMTIVDFPFNVIKMVKKHE